jgi:SAM-dependent methyltransferase
MKPMDERTLTAARYLQGEGLEIGAFNSPLTLPRGATVRYVDYAPLKELKRQFPDLKFQVPDLVDDGARLASIKDDSQDFLVACQMIEHTEDPIEAIENWLRVLKPGGVLFLTIPDRRFTFDFDRPVTSLEHLFKDHVEGPEWSRDAHYEETYRVILGIKDEELVRHHARLLRDEVGHTHFHVWTQLEMLEFILALRRCLNFDFEIENFNASGMEGIFILRKGVREGRHMAEESIRGMRTKFFGNGQKSEPHPGSGAKSET